MNPLGLDDILEPSAYERIRDVYRARVIEHKKLRRVSVGPQVTLLFEDRETLRYQIQEMIRVERTRDPDKIQLEVNVYNELIPGEGELSATLFIEITELAEVQPALDRLIGIDEHTALVVEGLEPVFARFDARQMEAERISAVHYLRFVLTPAHVQALAAGQPASLRIDHPHYRYETVLEPAKQASLARELAGEVPVLLDCELVREADEARDEILLETPHVRVRRLPGGGAREHVVVEAVSPDASLDDAPPALLAELFETTCRLAREIAGRSGAARVRLDLVSDQPGALRFEILARD